MADRAKFAFGSLASLDAALKAGTVDSFDLLCLYDEGVARIGWVNKQGEPILVDVPGDDVLVVDELPETGETGIIYIVNEVVYIWSGTQFIVISESTDLTEVKNRVASLEELVAALEEKSAATEERFVAIEEKAAELEADVATKTDAEEVDARYLSRMYEVTSKPAGTIVDYFDKEIRVMCPADTQWVKQNVGATGNANMYYMGFKAYAPEGAVSFKEDDKEVIEDQTMYYFEGNDFAGVDKYGRKYSIVWLALATYDEASDTWTYFGASSSAEKYIGWYYSVEWYDADGVMIASDKIRINLSNEECHSVIEPYYIANIKREMKSYTDEQIELKVQEVVEIPVVEF